VEDIMPVCRNCNQEFPNKIKIKERIYNLSGRKFCLDCSPLGSRNTRSYIVELKEDESFCARCSKIKTKGEFYTRKDSGRPFSYCIECQRDIKEIKFQEKLERIIEERNGYCTNCGGCFPIPLYEFYSDNGCYQLSKAKNMSLERLREALKDYVMLCLNCSAIRKWERSD
jgi:hypothetical protein